jgi:xanthine dehydrogenase accessory factor
MKRELPGMIALAERLLASDTPGTLATLFSARGSTYRTLGSMMVSLPGIRAGGVSGGCLEEYVARAGERATRRTPAAILSFSTHPDSDDDVPVLGCGGAIDVLVERLTRDHLAWLKGLAAAYEADEPALLGCLVTHSAERIVVDRAWLPKPADEVMNAEAIKRLCVEVSRDGRSRHTSMDSGGDVLVQYIPPLTRLVIVGGGDDAQPLCELGHALGWHVTVVDRRARLATATRFPTADVVLAGDWDDVLGAVAVTRRTAIVLMTHSLDDDARALSQLSEKECSYIGALGPPHRRQWLLEEVAAQRTALTASCHERLRGPVGLDLGDRSPTGIAVAISAEILARINNCSAHSLSNRVTQADVDGQRRVCNF